MVTLKKILENPVLKKLELIQEDVDLNNEVTNVGIVDYEFDKSYLDKIVYYEGDFLITSLYVAKDDESLLYKIVETLIGFGVCGLAIKNIYYKTIPKEVKDLAKKHRFPLFMFNNDLNFEDIIYEVLYELKKLEKTNYYEQLLDNIIKGFVSSQEGYDLLNVKPDEYYIFLIKSNNKLNLSLLRNSGLNVFVYDYYSSLIVFAKKEHNILYYLEYFNDKLTDNYHIGASDLTSDFQGSLKSTINNLKSALFIEEKVVYENNGYLTLLLENYQNDTYQKYMLDYLESILLDNILLDTLVLYQKYNGDIRLVSDKLGVHQNTLRYRINKAKNILDEDSTDLEFYKNLSLALTIYRLNMTDFVI